MPTDSLLAELDQELRAAGVPISGVSQGPGGVVVINYLPEATTEQIQLGEQILANFDWTIKRARRIYDILQDIQALNPTQQTAVWNDINSGSPPKWATVRENGDGIAALSWAVVASGATGTALADARRRLIAMYVQAKENWKYLVQPSFAPTVNIPGSEPDPDA